MKRTPRREAFDNFRLADKPRRVHSDSVEALNECIDLLATTENQDTETRYCGMLMQKDLRDSVLDTAKICALSSIMAFPTLWLLL